VQAPPSLWWSSLEHPVTARPALQRHLDVDVAIVGGGFTGLWTARELKRRDPSLRICVLEKSVCGFGASGRNGGWASALFPLSDQILVTRFGMERFTHQRHVLERSVGELGESARGDGIDAHFFQGGTVVVARNEVQAHRLRDSVEKSRQLGVAASDLAWLEKSEADQRATLSNSLGATYTPHCARIHPARLVRGLSDVDESLGVQIFENTNVTRILPGTGSRQPEVVTVGGSVHADFVVRATEGYTPTLPGERRTVAPFYSLMIATEPLPDSFWDEVGFAHHETFADDRRLIIYGQRTKDNRFAFGGRGASYHFGSTVEQRFDSDGRVFTMLEAMLRELFPTMNGAVTHRWGGPLAMPRDQTPSVLVDFNTGVASAGGYTGDGVVLSRVASIALADLLTSPDTETDFTRLSFVQHHSRRWEAEPLRWLGINSAIRLATMADRTEQRRGVDGRASKWYERLASAGSDSKPDPSPDA
jgi:glycine/D-amino acid oxidase-like deaminating enzyme